MLILSCEICYCKLLVHFWALCGSREYLLSIQRFEICQLNKVSVFVFIVYYTSRLKTLFKHSFKMYVQVGQFLANVDGSGIHIPIEWTTYVTPWMVIFLHGCKTFKCSDVCVGMYSVRALSSNSFKTLEGIGQPHAADSTM